MHFFPALAGYIGMNVATKANVRTANAARGSGGMSNALIIAFSEQFRNGNVCCRIRDIRVGYYI